MRLVLAFAIASLAGQASAQSDRHMLCVSSLSIAYSDNQKAQESRSLFRSLAEMPGVPNTLEADLKRLLTDMDFKDRAVIAAITDICDALS